MVRKSKSEAKHGRLFELIRQKNQSDRIVARVLGIDDSMMCAEQMAEFQLAATRSLQAQP